MNETGRSAPEFNPTPRISVRENGGEFVAEILGLQVLKCAGMRGCGSTREEAIRDLARRLRYFLDLAGQGPVRD